MHPLPSLSFHPTELAPHISESTVEAHHFGHEAGYSRKLNSALSHLVGLPSTPAHHWLSSASLPEILQRIEAKKDELPEPNREQLRVGAGGYLNHALYWWLMVPPAKRTKLAPEGRLGEAIASSFGSLDSLKAEMAKRSEALLGSGYVWVVADASKVSNHNLVLSLATTVNQDSVYAKQGMMPILVVDVWEHAYYLDQKQYRMAYFERWWQLIDWDKVESLFRCYTAKVLGAAKPKDEV